VIPLKSRGTRKGLVRVFLLLAATLALVSCTEKRQDGLITSGDELLSQNRPREAAELFRKAISLNAENRLATKALYKLGFTLETFLADYEGALFNYHEFIRLSQDSVSLYEVQKRVANILYDQNRDPDKAIAAYKKLISFNPDSLEVDQFQLRVGQSFFRQNNFEQSRIEFQALIEKYPKSALLAKARFEIGNAYFMEAKYDIAQEAFKQVMRLHPQSEFAAEAQFLMAQCLENKNEFAQAKSIYEGLKGRYPAADVLEFRLTSLEKRIKKAK
jgi:TolA-binding protein